MKIVLLFPFILLLTPPSYSQNTPANPVREDSLVYTASVQNAVNFYHRSVYPETGLYNGGQYVDYIYTIKEGNPYFLSTGYAEGSLCYDKVHYQQVQLIYDMVKECLITQDPTHLYKVALNNEKISSFSILGHNFVRLIADSSDNQLPGTGFYECLYSGSLAVFKKEKKELKDREVSNNIIRYVQVTSDYYIRKDGKYFPVGNKKSVLHLLADRKKQLESYIRKNSLKIRRNPDIAYAGIAAYYDTITTP